MLWVLRRQLLLDGNNGQDLPVAEGRGRVGQVIRRPDLRCGLPLLFLSDAPGITLLRCHGRHPRTAHRSTPWHLDRKYLAPVSFGLYLLHLFSHIIKMIFSQRWLRQ